MKTLLQLALVASIGIAFALPATAAERGPVPEGQKAAYERVDPQLPIGPSPLVNFKPKKGPPWKIGYASNYAGNGWRAAIMDEFTN
ncbi:sugar ABC transporter substrate-binding protein, partial [Mesorhizobium sp. M2A.F.Ca.ET.039.01.1.1]